MPSPFPGMDPYLEHPAFWRDFHGELIYACRNHLLDRLPEEYDATVDVEVRLVGRDSAGEVVADREVLPDVAVLRTGPAESRRPAAAPGSGRGMAVLEPVVVEIPDREQVTERWIEIRHRPDDALVTVVEILSPTNKDRAGLGRYQLKRDAILDQNANLVEIDLLVGGQRPEPPGRMPPGDYFALVTRADEPNRRRIYAWPVRHPLPEIPIPLQAPAQDVKLDLAIAFTAAYDRGRFNRRLRYRQPPVARLADADRTWAAELVAGKPAVGPSQAPMEGTPE